MKKNIFRYVFMQLVKIFVFYVSPYWVKYNIILLILFVPVVEWKDEPRQANQHFERRYCQIGRKPIQDEQGEEERRGKSSRVHRETASLRRQVQLTQQVQGKAGGNFERGELDYPIKNTDSHLLENA